MKGTVVNWKDRLFQNKRHEEAQIKEVRQMKDQILKGVITDLNGRHKCWGTIISEDGKDFFLFWQYVTERPDLLAVGDIVEFTADEEDPRTKITRALQIRQTGEKLETIKSSGGTGFQEIKIAPATLQEFIGRECIDIV
ncbi:MAG: hypothetical protein GX581_08690 [Syntrophomonadaceae bacterium]|nr:hypothetical protein [Syntrophomonadaceae bacterium]